MVARRRGENQLFIRDNTECLPQPVNELFDLLGSIGIREDIPITCSEKIYLDFYPTDETDEISKIVCDRLSETDKIFRCKCAVP